MRVRGEFLKACLCAAFLPCFGGDCLLELRQLFFHLSFGGFAGGKVGIDLVELLAGGGELAGGGGVVLLEAGLLCVEKAYPFFCRLAPLRELAAFFFQQLGGISYFPTFAFKAKIAFFKPGFRCLYLTNTILQRILFCLQGVTSSA